MLIQSLAISGLFILAFSCKEKAQPDKLILGEDYAKKELKEALSDTIIHNVVSNGSIVIKDRQTAINVVEPILFGIYGKNNIKSQRPYESYLIDNYWVISGTLPNGFKGGTFLIILDATNSRIVRLSHGQ